MLISFRLRNYRSVRDEQEILFTRSARMHQSSTTEAESFGDPSVSPVAAFYGANASGKSNILDALAFMARAVEDSHAEWKRDRNVPYVPFAFDTNAAEVPTLLEAVVRIGDSRYQYGFEYTAADGFLREWLYAYPHGRRRVWFERDESSKERWHFGKALTGPNRVTAEVTRRNSLFLSAAATMEHPKLAPIYDWFANRVRLATQSNYRSRLYWTLDAIENNRSRIDQVKALLRHADLGISDVQIQRREFTEEQRKRILKVAKAMLSDGSEASAPTFEDDFIEREFERVSTTVKLHHACDDGTSVPLDFDDESLGTKSLVALSGPVLQALDLGFTLLVDEVDTSLHPRIVAEVVGLFQSPVTNPAQAQLIFTTHDTSLLNSTVDERPLLDRDQVWLVEKDRTGATSVYPLSDFSPRKHENLERGYLQGRYGGVPFIDDEGLRQELEVAGGALGANGS